MHLSRSTKRAYLAMGACVLVAMGIDFLSHYHLLITQRRVEAIHPFTFSCYACFILIWLRLGRQRFLDRRVLACMRVTGWAMILWLLVRTVKYELTYGVPGLCSRYLWYAFYLGFTFVPVGLFLAVLYIGKRQGETIARPWWLLLVGAAVLSGLVLTNDLHRLAFRFEAPLDFWETSDETSYSHGPVFYLVFVWLAVLAVAAVGIALVRCKRATGSMAMMVPLGILGLGLFYVLLYVTGPIFRVLFPLRAVEFTCVMTVLFMESLVALGLFPSNERYGELWRASSLRGALVDVRGNVVVAAAGAPEVDPRQIVEAQAHPLALPDNQVLAARRVQGGVAYWVRDLTHMRGLQEQLEELGDTLAEENEVLEAENALWHEREAVRQRTALYDKIAALTEHELDELARRLNGVPTDEDAFVAHMNRAAVTASCLKRSANLVLAGESGEIDLRELALAFEEVAVWLRTCGAVVTVQVRGEGTIATEEGLEAFDAFCGCIGCLPDNLAGVCIACQIDARDMEVEVRSPEQHDVQSVVHRAFSAGAGLCRPSTQDGVSEEAGGA